jgi:predicted dehydrogenase
MKPRIGFLGLGWIGQSRLRALVDAGVADVAALADPRSESTARVASDLQGVSVCPSLDALLDESLDGVVIATPSALHADQAIACLERGLAVFCQKPLARSREEAERVVTTARRVNRRLAVDMSYRHTAAHNALKQLVEDGSLGTVHTADFVFHNAYGPDQAWYYSRALAGGGCLMDLGVHLLDQIQWMLGWADANIVDARLRCQGRAWDPSGTEVEDFAHLLLEGPDRAVARVVCSWRAPAGCDARIGIELIGTQGGARLTNVGGSFYEFRAERWNGTRTIPLADPPDAWGGRALVAWARALSASASYDVAVEQQIALTAMIDRVYAWQPAMFATLPADARLQPLETP